MTTEATPHLGIDEAHREGLIKGLETLLADTYTTYLHTQGFHWNVTGHRFHSLHEMFEEQYTQLAAAVDELAERIRALGGRAPGSLAEMLKLATLNDSVEAADADQMVDVLLGEHEALIGAARELADYAGEANDVATEDLATERIREHEKTAWMLRATIA